MTIHEVNLAYEKFVEFQKAGKDDLWYSTRRMVYQIYLSTSIKGNHKSIDVFWPDWNNEKSKIPNKSERMKRYKKLMDG